MFRWLRCQTVYILYCVHFEVRQRTLLLQAPVQLYWFMHTHTHIKNLSKQYICIYTVYCVCTVPLNPMTPPTIAPDNVPLAKSLFPRYCTHKMKSCHLQLQGFTTCSKANLKLTNYTYYGLHCMKVLDESIINFLVLHIKIHYSE